jgi:hypothetical protein
MLALPTPIVAMGIADQPAPSMRLFRNALNYVGHYLQLYVLG